VCQCSTPFLHHPPQLSVSIHLPEWIDHIVDWNTPLTTDSEKMALALLLAAENVQRQTGGPFATIIVHKKSGMLLSVGVNQVVPQTNSTLHGEVMAIMMGEQRLRQYSLSQTADEYELFTSCEPCAMCMGAILWSGVKRLVCSATGDDARAIGFDEGPVFESSYDYIQNAGIEVLREVLHKEGQAVLNQYIASGGKLYNGATE